MKKPLNNKPHHVMLILHLQGEYEKIAHHLVYATNERRARQYAIENEAHNDLRWEDKYDTSSKRARDCAWDGDYMYYEVYQVTPLTNAEVAVLNRCNI